MALPRNLFLFFFLLCLHSITVLYRILFSIFFFSSSRWAFGARPFIIIQTLSAISPTYSWLSRFFRMACFAWRSCSFITVIIYLFPLFSHLAGLSFCSAQHFSFSSRVVSVRLFYHIIALVFALFLSSCCVTVRHHRHFQHQPPCFLPLFSLFFFTTINYTATIMGRGIQISTPLLTALYHKSVCMLLFLSLEYIERWEGSTEIHFR
jgi:hypothetical protein